MQTTIVKQAEAPGLEENDVISSIRGQAAIRSVTVRKGEPVEPNSSTTAEKFSVVGLLQDASYTVVANHDSYELIFPAKREYLVVTAAVGSDLMEIADYMTNHLATVTANN